VTQRATIEICSISLRCIPVGRDLLEARLVLLVWWLSDIDLGSKKSFSADGRGFLKMGLARQQSKERCRCPKGALMKARDRPLKNITIRLEAARRVEEVWEPVHARQARIVLLQLQASPYSILHRIHSRYLLSR